MDNKIENMVKKFIDMGMMFTSVEIANAIKRDGDWVSNTDVASQIYYTSSFRGSSYCISSIKVDSGTDVVYTNCYHNLLDNPDNYLARDLRAITPDEFAEMHKPKKEKKIKMDTTKEIVVMDNGVPMTDTRIIAETFKKRHANVLQKIEKLGMSEEFARLHFKLCSYGDENGRQRSMYKMDQDGWALVVMGFTGAKAMKFKEKYINAFRALNTYVEKAEAQKIPQTFAEALLLASQQAEQLAIAAPKAEYHDTVAGIGTAILIGSFSKILAPDIIIGQNNLFTLLRDNKILQSLPLHKKNMPYQYFIDMGYFVVRQGTRPSISEGTKLTFTTYITGKGQIWLTKKLKTLLNLA